LVQADWSADGGVPKSVLPPGERQATPFEAPLPELKPGAPMRVQVRARSKHSDQDTEERWVVYYPPLPAVAVDPLGGPVSLTQKVTRTGRFESATQDPFDFFFRVASPEAQTMTFKPEVDLKARTWKVELSLYPGLNTIQALVANKWRGERAVEW